MKMELLDKEMDARSSYLLDYEKHRLTTCARSFGDLAKVFEYIPNDNSPEPGDNRENLLWKKRLLENRELLADNLREMADIMEHVAGVDVHARTSPKGKKKRMSKLLEEEGILIQDMYILSGCRTKRKIAVIAKSKKEMTITTARLAEYLSILMNEHLQTCESSPLYLKANFEHLYFEEEPKFRVMSGFAKATKETEKISGDNHSFFETGQGIFTAILSDGMGSGEKACADSEVVVDMAEKLMDTGFSMEMTVQMINDALIAGAGETNMSTLDLCSVDLKDGEASFIKIGSAATYVKSGDTIEKIPSMSLPLGIFHKLEASTKRRSLQNGDYIIMLSDGITDCLCQKDGDGFVEELIGNIGYARPTEIANCILKYALHMSKGHIKDDMTVLVMGFWENDYED